MFAKLNRKRALFVLMKIHEGPWPWSEVSAAPAAHPLRRSRACHLCEVVSRPILAAGVI